MEFYGREWTDEERALAQANAARRTHRSGRTVRHAWEHVDPAFEHDPLDDLLDPPKEIDGFAAVVNEVGDLPQRLVVSREMYEMIREAKLAEMERTSRIFARLQREYGAKGVIRLHRR